MKSKQNERQSWKGKWVLQRKKWKKQWQSNGTREKSGKKRRKNKRNGRDKEEESKWTDYNWTKKNKQKEIREIYKNNMKTKKQGRKYIKKIRTKNKSKWREGWKRKEGQNRDPGMKVQRAQSHRTKPKAEISARGRLAIRVSRKQKARLTESRERAGRRRASGNPNNHRLGRRAIS